MKKKSQLSEKSNIMYSVIYACLKNKTVLISEDWKWEAEKTYFTFLKITTYTQLKKVK